MNKLVNKSNYYIQVIIILNDKYPISIIEDPYTLQKYNPPVPKGLQSWSWFQLIITNLFMYHMLVSLGDLSASSITLYVTFLFIFN